MGTCHLSRTGWIHAPFPGSTFCRFDVIPQLPALYDEPFADSSEEPTFLVSRIAGAILHNSDRMIDILNDLARVFIALISAEQLIAPIAGEADCNDSG